MAPLALSYIALRHVYQSAVTALQVMVLLLWLQNMITKTNVQPSDDTHYISVAAAVTLSLVSLR